MDDAAHVELLEVLLELEGFIVLSGYPNPIYDSKLAAWDRYETSARISASRGTANRTEVVWINPRCSRALAYPVNGLLGSWRG
jgi:DNA adenine methylase